jgi:hypothetical protein
MTHRHLDSDITRRILVRGIPNAKQNNLAVSEVIPDLDQPARRRMALGQMPRAMSIRQKIAVAGNISLALLPL